MLSCMTGLLSSKRQTYSCGNIPRDLLWQEGGALQPAVLHHAGGEDGEDGSL